MHISANYVCMSEPQPDSETVSQQAAMPMQLKLEWDRLSVSEAEVGFTNLQINL